MKQVSPHIGTACIREPGSPALPHPAFGGLNAITRAASPLGK